MAENVQSIAGLRLCFSSCEKVERIHFEQIIAQPSLENVDELPTHSLGIDDQHSFVEAERRR